MHFKTQFAIATCFSVISALAVPNPLPGGVNTVVRDPAIWYNPTLAKYFVFATGSNIGIFTSTSLNGPWAREGSVLPNCSKIPNAGNCTGLWAPDVNFLNGQYVLYYSVSSIGKQTSAIGVATSPTMVSGAWTDLGAVVTSSPADVFNAIDPNIIDFNGLKLSFGSYWEGIYQIGIWPAVNNPASPTPGTHLAGGGGRSAEGGFTYKPVDSPYWFFFFSDGITPLPGSTTRPPPGDEYKVRVGRGTGGMGPFFDQSNRNLLETNTPLTGTIVLASHDNVYAPGGQSIFHDPQSGRHVIVYHYVKNNENTGTSYLGINYLDFSSGWPVVVT